MLVWIIFS